MGIKLIHVEVVMQNLHVHQVKQPLVETDILERHHDIFVIVRVDDVDILIQVKRNIGMSAACKQLSS